jgi:hypothetical protein
MKRDLATTYFDNEGRDSMQECITHAFEWCVVEHIGAIVIFSGTGEGPLFAGKELLPQSRFSTMRVVAVTPPSGRPYKANPTDPNSPIVRAGRLSGNARRADGPRHQRCLGSPAIQRDQHRPHARVRVGTRGRVVRRTGRRFRPLRPPGHADGVRCRSYRGRRKDR